MPKYPYYHLWCWKMLCTLTEEKDYHKYHIANNSVNFNRDLPASYTGIIVAEILWEQLTIFLKTRFKVHSIR